LNIESTIDMAKKASPRRIECIEYGKRGTHDHSGKVAQSALDEAREANSVKAMVTARSKG
jgi:uncharacterized protein (UPF0262 family)